MAVIGAIKAIFTADTSRFSKNVKKARKGVKGFGKSMAGAKKLLVAFAGAALAAAGIGGIMAMVKSVAETIDRVGKLSVRLGIATEKLMGLQHAAGLSGASAEQLNKGLATLQKNIGEVAGGIGTEAASALDAIGLSADNIVSMSADEQFIAIAGGISQLATQSEKAAVAQKLFGRSGMELLNLLDAGAPAVRSMVSEMEQLGGTVTGDQAKAIENMNDAMSRFRVAATGGFNQLVATLAPYATAAINSVTGAVVRLRDWFVKAFERVRMFVAPVFPFLQKIAARWVDYVLENIVAIGSLFVSTWQRLVTIFSGVMAIFNSDVGVLGDTFYWLLDTVWSTITGLLRGIAFISEKMTALVQGDIDTLRKSYAEFAKEQEQIAAKIKSDIAALFEPLSTGASSFGMGADGLFDTAANTGGPGEFEQVAANRIAIGGGSRGNRATVSDPVAHQLLNQIANNTRGAAARVAAG